ncbi:UDP-glucosyltransferase 2-like [Vespula maculifrons]|uniref:UDP-glucosyltransferase 2-like n=1 Tax=Vespula maculifrons TaxID=7453 RepID=A0ABD2CTS0_VESMC
MFETLTKGLAKKGHQVDVISPFPQKRPFVNYTDLIVIPPQLNIVNNISYNIAKNIWTVQIVSVVAGNDICEHLAHPDIQKLIHNPPKDPPYDVVLIQVFAAHCFAIFGHLFNVPVIGISPPNLYPWYNSFVGNPKNLAILPNNLLPFVNPMNFWQRIYNTLSTAINQIYFNHLTEYQDEQIRKYVGPNLPSVRQLEANISMILVNSYFSLDGIRPLTQAIVEVGGLHVQDDNSKLPPISPVNVLIKIANPKELPPGLPKNIRISSWLPQLKVLKHRNVKAFITHGGLLGTQEAISYGVPMIGIPLFSDQFTNIANYVKKNIAVKLDYENLSEDNMDAALNAILYNSTYREAARKLAQQFLDRPLKPIDTASFWIEYIVKYGKDALRSPAMDLNWWQVELLDVYAFLLFTSIVIVYITIHLTLMFLNMISSKRLQQKKCLYLRTTCQCSTDGYRILGVFPINGRSHWIMMEALMKGLAERGHQVDVVTHFKTRSTNPNYREIILENILGSAVNNLTAKEILYFGSMNIERLTYMAGLKLCELMEQPRLQEIIKNPPKNPPYDLVITELFAGHCYLAFGRHLKVPMIGMMSSPFHDWAAHQIGVPDETSYVPNIFSGYSQQMTFWERLINTITVRYLQMQMDYYTNLQTEIVKRSFGIDATINDLFKNLSLVLVNSHHSMHGIRPFPQSVVEIGGLHLTNDIDPLAPEVQKWLDESKHGCIYFTFGSMVRIETFSKELMEAFYKAFEKIAPVRVLMKVAKKEELLPGLPKNVMTQSWFSQIPILKHKNTRVFITHGGLMGTTESIFCGVPMIGIPLFGDQKVNIQNYVKRKVAISLGSIHEVTEEKLTNALETILKDPSYTTNVKKLSQLFVDRPQTAMDTATYWVEYVIKHGNILQSPAIHVPWWQKSLLDIYGALLLAIIITLYLIILVLRGLKYIYQRNFGDSDNKKKKTSTSKKYN